MSGVINAVQQFGFPIVAMVGLGYFVYFVWTTITKVINLDNDKIRLQQKVNTVLQMKENEKKK